MVGHHENIESQTFCLANLSLVCLTNMIILLIILVAQFMVDHNLYFENCFQNYSIVNTNFHIEKQNLCLLGIFSENLLMVNQVEMTII